MRVSLPIITLLVLMLVSFASSAEASQRVKVVEPFIPIYTGPGIGYPVFLDLERDSWLSIQRQQADWYEVTTDKGETGWVKQDELAKTVTADNLLVELYDERQIDFTHRNWELGALWGEAGDANIFTLFGGFVFTNNLAVELSVSQMIGSLSTSNLIDVNLIAQPFPECGYLLILRWEPAASKPEQMRRLCRKKIVMTGRQMWVWVSGPI